MSPIVRLVVALAVALLLPGTGWAKRPGSEPPPPPATDFHLAVVPNLSSNDVSVLDTDTHTEVARIPVGPRPLYAAASPDGQFAYVGEDGFGTPPIRIDRINLRTLAVESVLTVGGSNHLVELEISPNGLWLVAGEIYKGTTYIIDTDNWVITATLVLCPICDGQTQALFSTPNFAFSADSSTLYAATHVNDLLTVVDLATGTVIETRPAQTSFGSAYNDVERAPDEQVVLSHPDSGGTVRVFDIPGGTQANLSIQQSSVTDFALVPAGDRTLVATGSILYGASEPDFLSLKPLQGGPEVTIPSSESLRYLRYNRLRNELWATCVGFVGFCAPFQIDVFDLGTLTRTHTLTGVSGGATLTRFPAFTPNEEFYYQPMGVLDTVLVIDTATKQVVTQIPVGSNPRTVRMQGDVGPHER